MSGPIVDGPTEPGRRSTPLLRTVLGHVLRRTRLEQGRTLAEVAKAARVSMPYLSELERGRKEASSEVLAAVCEALRIELPDVLARVGRDMARHHARPASIVQLDAVRARRAATRRGFSGDVQCLLAA